MNTEQEETRRRDRILNRLTVEFDEYLEADPGWVGIGPKFSEAINPDMTLTRSQVRVLALALEDRTEVRRLLVQAAEAEADSRTKYCKEATLTTELHRRMDNLRFLVRESKGRDEQTISTADVERALAGEVTG